MYLSKAQIQNDTNAPIAVKDRVPLRDVTPAHSRLDRFGYRDTATGLNLA